VETNIANIPVKLTVIIGFLFLVRRLRQK